MQDHNPTAENESHSNAKLTDALEHKHRNTLTTPNHLTKKLHKFSDLSLLCFKLISFRALGHVVESVQMETKRSGGGGDVTVGQASLLTCAWEALATLLTSALLSLAAQDPFALSTACGQKSEGDNESEHSNYKAVDADEDGDEEKNNDGGLGETEEELSSDDGGGSGNNPNGKSNNSKAESGGDAAGVGEDGEEEEEDGNNRDDDDDDGDDDGDQDNEDDEDEEENDDDEGEDKEEEEIVEEDEPEDEEEDEEEALQPPKKRKK